LRTPAPYLAVGTALAAYSPVIIYNFKYNFASLHSIMVHDYAFDSHPTLTGFMLNLGPLIAVIGRAAIGSFGQTGWRSLWTDGGEIVFVLLTGCALIYAARRREKLQLLAILIPIIPLAVLGHPPTIPTRYRYVAFLSALIFVEWAISFTGIWDALASSRISPRRAGFARAGLACALFVLFITPLLALKSYYADAFASGQNNAAFLAMVELTRAQRDEPVLIDRGLAELPTCCGSDVSQTMTMLLALDRREYQLVSPAEPDGLTQLKAYLREHDHVYLIAFSRAARDLGSTFSIKTLLRAQYDCPNCRVAPKFGLFQAEGVLGAEGAYSQPTSANPGR
jgi:hypothetical protein